MHANPCRLEIVKLLQIIYRPKRHFRDQVNCEARDYPLGEGENDDSA